jgi:SSS family solute:Na+ symporter
MLPTIIGLYLAATLLVGLVFSTRIKRASDYLLAGRNLGVALTTASLAAVQIGAGVVLGGAEKGAELGLWPGTWYGLGCGFGLIFGGLVAAGRFRELGGIVPIDFFGWRYGERRWVRGWALLSHIPSLLGIFAAQLMAAGLVMAGFGFDFTWSVLVIGAVILVANVLSGMWGVVSVDLVQVAILTVGIPIAAVAASVQPFSVPVGSLVATPFIPRGMLSEAVFLITPFLFSISVSYDAFIRYQSAKNASVARWGCILAGILVIGVSFFAALIGAMGRAAYPEVDNGAVLTHVVTNALPPALAGVVVAALLAAAMSTANALLISISGCFSRDFYNMILHPGSELDDLPRAKLYARIAVAVALVVGVVVALRARGILDTIIIFSYPYMASMLVPLLGGLLWPRGTRRGAYAAMAVGGAIGVVAFLAGVPGPLRGAFNIDFALLIAFGVTAVVYVLVSLASDAPSTPERAA